jgi:hypothetical protein
LATLYDGVRQRFTKGPAERKRKARCTSRLLIGAVGFCCCAKREGFIKHPLIQFISLSEFYFLIGVIKMALELFTKKFMDVAAKAYKGAVASELNKIGG